MLQSDQGATGRAEPFASKAAGALNAVLNPPVLAGQHQRSLAVHVAAVELLPEGGDCLGAGIMHLRKRIEGLHQGLEYPDIALICRQRWWACQICWGNLRTNPQLSKIPAGSLEPM